MFEIDTTRDDAVALSSPLPSSALGAVISALVLPVLAAGFTLAGPFLPLHSHVHGVLVHRTYVATILVTAILLALDARRLGPVGANGKSRESPVLLLIGIGFLWCFFYPLAFFWRKSFGGPHLGYLALIVTVLFVGAPFASLLIPRGLPSCTSMDVASLVEQTFRGTHSDRNVISIDGHRELSYDRDANVRQGECIAHTDGGDVPINYFVEWQDQKSGVFQVRLIPSELPLCTNSLIKKLIDQIISKAAAGQNLKSIDGHRELAYEREANFRRGECIVHTDEEDISVEFIIEWKDRAKGEFQVRTLAAR